MIIYLIGIHIFPIGFSLCLIVGAGQALPREQGPRGRPSEGRGGPPTAGPRREGPAQEAGPAPGPAPPMGNSES